MGIIRSTLKRFGSSVRKMLGFGFNLVGNYATSQGQKLLGLGKIVYDKAYWLKAYDEQPLVQIPIGRLARDFSLHDFRLREVTYSEDAPPRYRRIYQHPFLSLLKHPEPDMTGICMREMWIRHWETCGDVILWISRRSILGEPTEMILVEPHKLSETPLDNGENVYRFTVGEGLHQKIITAPAKDVCYWCNPSAFACHHHGVGRITALSREIKLDEKSSDWSLSVYQNGSHVGAVVHVPDFGEDDLKELQEEWDSKYTGIGNVGRTLFVSSDTVEGAKNSISVQRIGGQHQELDWRESKNDLLKRALLLFGIPPQVVGMIEGGSRSDTSGADYIHQSKNVLPLLERFAKELELRLLSQFRDYESLEVYYDNPVKEEAAFRHQRLMEGMDRGAADRNEWRLDAGLDPMGGVIGEALSLPLNMTHVDQDANVLIEPDHEAPAPRDHDDAENASSQVAINHANDALAALKGMTFEHQDAARQ